MFSVSLIATAIGLGTAYSATPGAVNTEAIRRGVTKGARSALLVETGSLIGDSLWALLALTGVTLLTRYLAVQVVLAITGGFFLLRLAWLSLSEAFTGQHTSSGHIIAAQGDFATGVVFGLANPVGLAFWSGLGSSVITWGVTGWQSVVFFAGFFLGAMLWCMGISAVIRWGRRWIQPSLFRWINALCGLTLGYFGICVLWSTVQDWLSHQVVSPLKPMH